MIKKHKKKLLSTLAITIFAISALGVPVNVLASSSFKASVTRLGGYDMYETATKVAEHGWSKADIAIIAPAGIDNTVETLASSSLAKAVNAPILLTDLNSIPYATLNELQKLKVKNVYLIGGTNVTSTQVESQLTQAGILVTRLGGANRFETTVSIAKELKKFSSSKEVVITNGYSSADAVSIGAIAAAKGIPILAVDKDKTPVSVASYIKDAGITKTYVIGGVGVISNTVMNSCPTAERISGFNRYDTNREVLKRFQNIIAGGKLFFANGEDYSLVDSLTGAPMIAKLGGAIVLTNKDSIDESTLKFIKSNLAFREAGILGGTAVMNDSITDDLNYYEINKNDDNGLELSKPTIIDSSGYDLSDSSTTGSIYVNSSNVTLGDVVISGTLFLNPGSSGYVDLENVVAKNIVILSGSGRGISLINTKCENLIINSSSTNTTVVAGKDSSFGLVTILSDSTLELDDAADLNKVSILGYAEDKIQVTLKGLFVDAVTLSGKVKLLTKLNTNNDDDDDDDDDTITETKINTLTISEAFGNDSISLDGTFNIVNVLDNSAVTLSHGVITTMTLKGDSSLIVSDGYIDALLAEKTCRIVIKEGSEIAELRSKSTSTKVSGGGMVNGDVTGTNPAEIPDSSTSSKKQITAFSFSGITSKTVIDQADHTITIKVPYNTDITELIPLVTTSKGAECTFKSNEAYSFSKDVIVRVVAQDYTTQKYTIIVEEEDSGFSSSKSMTQFRFESLGVRGVIDGSARTILVEVPYGTNVRSLLPTISISEDATIYPNTAQDFTIPVKYTVTAEDKSERTFTVTVTILPDPTPPVVTPPVVTPPVVTPPVVTLSSSKSITQFTLGSLNIEGNINSSSKTIAIEVPYGTDVTSLTPTILISDKAKISPNTAQDFKKPVSYTVTAEDGSTSTFIATIKVLADTTKITK